MYADEGTAAHELAESCLICGGDAREWLGHQIEVNGRVFVVNEEMAGAVQVYLDHVRRVLEHEQCATRPFFSVEYKVDLSWLREGMYGTADLVIYDGYTIWVIDYKHGKGHAVTAKGNTQLRYYALGPAWAYRCESAAKVVMTIVQPRAEHPEGRIRTDTMTKDALLAWATQELGPAVDATRKPGAARKAGAWCRWCAALAVCPEAMEKAQEDAAVEFSRVDPEWDPKTFVPLDPGTLSTILKAKDFVVQYLNAVKVEAHRRLAAGEELPGWKRIRGMARRRWKGEPDEVAQFLEAWGVIYDRCWNRKIISPAEAERQLSALKLPKEEKKEAKDGLKEFWEKLPGKPRVVREDQPGEAIGPNDAPDVPEDEFTALDFFE